MQDQPQGPQVQGDAHVSQLLTASLLLDCDRKPSEPKMCHTVGTKIIADLEKCFRELISEKVLILLRDGPCLELIIVSSNFQALLLLQDELLESV